jgi:hypothetical protein
MKTILYAFTVTAFLAAGCGSLNAPDHPSGLPICYHNAQYDFTFFLPASWQGYSVSIQAWKPSDSVTPEHGMKIVFRNPRWQAGDPYEDIPILVFTRSQWDADRNGKLSYGAGGVESEIAHNRKYVFAIWSRAFFDELKGREEADRIVQQNETANGPHLHSE